MVLSDLRIKNTPPREKPFKVSDERGLFLLIFPSGSRLWRFKYRFKGKEKSLSFGAYPKVSLKIAREKREEAKKMLKAGLDPSERKKEVKRLKKQKDLEALFSLHLSPREGLTITMKGNLMTLESEQVKALKAFLDATQLRGEIHAD